MQTRKETGWMRQRSSVGEEQLKLKCHWTKNNILSHFSRPAAWTERWRRWWGGSWKSSWHLSPAQIFATFVLFERIILFLDPSADLNSLLELEIWKNRLRGNQISLKSMFLSCVFLHSKYAACLEWSKILRGDKSPAWAADLSLPTYSYLFFICTTNFVGFVL